MDSLHSDTRPAQAARVADFLELHPYSTAKQIDAACDTGCITKVLSDMPRLGYGLGKDWQRVACAHGQRMREVRTYVLLYRPTTQPGLFDDQLIRAALEDLGAAGQLPPHV